MLIDKGWIPLRQMGVLLGYKNPRGIYPRQRGPNAIPTVRIGGTIRVYAVDVLEALENVPEKGQVDAQTLLSLYKTGLKAHQRTLGD